jgi:hypothetical protein
MLMVVAEQTAPAKVMVRAVEAKTGMEAVAPIKMAMEMQLAIRPLAVRLANRIHRAGLSTHLQKAHQMMLLVEEKMDVEAKRLHSVK